ncbi:MAG: protein kinase [Lachnospiraceae bacterium]|nr:protein kinase [Lachnospiraceae bacterium]
MENIGKYRILSKVGQGGIASVYLAEDERIGKKWAIKAIPKSNIPKDGILLLRNLDHPSIPRIVEELEGDGMYYEVMDYFEGIPLDRWAETGPDALDVICISQEILESVAYLHSREIPIIHRDLKPSNFIITADRKVKLVDFDLAVSGE